MESVQDKISAQMFFFGTLSHMILDGIVNGTVMPFYPFSTWAVGLDLISYFIPNPATLGDTYLIRATLMAGLDSALLISWLIYEEYRHRIKDYI
jgi:membrane-bound metal-dependent hydrolase YbcI (DUF457 family)